MKILCIRLSAIGDLVVTTPILRALHHQLGAEVHVLTKALPAEVLRHNPHVRRVLHWPETNTATLRREAYDLLLDLHCNLRSHRMRLSLGVPALGYRKRNLEKWLLTQGLDLLGREHLVDRYFRAFATLGIRDDGGGLDYFTAPEELAHARQLLRSIGPGEPFSALVLAATHATKRMPIELLVRTIAAAPERRFVLLGGADVRALADELLQRLPKGSRERVLDLVNACPLRISVAVLAEADVVITPDTGLMHLAAALKLRIVSVWGSTAPGFGMYPHLPKAHARPRYVDAEVRGLDCHPCSRIGYGACPRGHFKCMHEQQPDGWTEAS